MPHIYLGWLLIEPAIVTVSKRAPNFRLIPELDALAQYRVDVQTMTLFTLERS